MLSAEKHLGHNVLNSVERLTQGTPRRLLNGHRYYIGLAVHKKHEFLRQRCARSDSSARQSGGDAPKTGCLDEDASPAVESGFRELDQDDTSWWFHGARRFRASFRFPDV
jgi:hypothetical protein